MKKLDRLTSVINVIVAILLVICVGATFIQVVRREVFGTVFKWAEEIAIYSTIWVTFLGAVLCLRHGEHTRIEALLHLFPKKVQKWIEVFDLLVCFAFMAILGYHSIELLAINGGYRSAASGIPMVMVYSCILVSGILMIPYFGILIYQKITEKDDTTAEVANASADDEGGKK